MLVRRGYFIDGGGGGRGASSQRSSAARPPDYVVSGTYARDGGGRFSILGFVGRVLDTPYEYITEKGFGLVERLRRRALEEKGEGDKAEAFLWALGASTASFVTGVGAGIAGLFSPRAWRETFQAIRSPGETLRTLASDPLMWPYTLGSIVGPGKAAKALTRSRVLEADLAAARGRGVIIGRVAESGHRWVAALELEAPVVEVKGRSAKPRGRYFTVWTSRGWAEVAELPSGGVQRVRVERLKGKTVRVAEEWRLERGRFRGRIIIADPELVLRERKAAPKGSVETVVRLIGEIEPPRVAVKSGRPGLFGGVLGGLAGLGSSSEMGVLMRARASEASVMRAGVSGASTGRIDGVGPAGADVVSLFGGGVGRRVGRGILGMDGWSGGDRKGRSGVRRYSEILYPAPAFPL